MDYRPSGGSVGNGQFYCPGQFIPNRLSSGGGCMYRQDQMEPPRFNQPRPTSDGNIFPTPWSMMQGAQPQQWQQQQNSTVDNGTSSIGCMPMYPPCGHPTPGSPSSYNCINRQEQLQQPIYPSAADFAAFYSNNQPGSNNNRQY